MCKIQEQVSKFIDDYNLCGKKILVGFSGGYDSICLLNVLSELKKKKNFSNLIAIHYNHNWRGDKAKQEQENCKKFCKSKGIEFYTETAPDEIKKNETEAREMRYDFFERALKKYNACCVMTAHNYDDNAETILYRIIKGTGIVGLKGILPQRGNYYRPLINVLRTDIENYCKQNNLTPNHDESNEDTIHKRNLIRHDIMPLLAKINPDVKKSLNSLAQIAVSENEIIDEYISSISKRLYDKNTIKTKEYTTLSKQVKQKIIYNLIYNSEFDYSMETIIRVYDFIEKTLDANKPSKYSIGKNGWIYVDTNIIELISSSESFNDVIKLNGENEYKILDKTFKIEECGVLEKTKTEDIAYVDLSKFDNLYIRTRKDGDIIQPLGMSGTMKLKKYFMSKKIPQHKRNKIILLTTDTEVLWVSGVGLSEKIKVKNKPTHKLSVY